MKRIFVLLLTLLLSLALFTTAFAASSAEFVRDGAELLSEGEENELSARLKSVSETYGAQITVVTLPTLDGENVGVYANTYYDEENLGYGEDRAGVLLLVSMENPRECYILGNGFAATAVDDYTIECILDVIVPDLTAENYAASFQNFADECAYYLDMEVNGVPFDPIGTLGFSLIVGLVIGLVYTLSLKGQLKSVRGQRHANVYVKNGSMKLTQSGDYFLYRHVTRTERPQNTSSGSSRSGGGGARSGGGRGF